MRQTKQSALVYMLSFLYAGNDDAKFLSYHLLTNFMVMNDVNLSIRFFSDIFKKLI